MAGKKPENDVAKYDKDELMGNAKALFRVNPEVAAGAFQGLDQLQYTVDEAKRLIGQFLKRKVL